MSMRFGRKQSEPTPSATPAESAVSTTDSPENIGAVVAQATAAPTAAATPADPPSVESSAAGNRHRTADSIVRSKHYASIRQVVFSTIDVSHALSQSQQQVHQEISAIINETVHTDNLPVTMVEQRQMAQEILQDMFGVGPIEPLLADETVSDVLVNGPDQVYVERFGKLELTSLKFRDHAHVINVAQRIATSVGRRVDESSPLVDARLQDGSRVNVVLPPLALDGASISIRKFSRKDLTLPKLAERGTMSSAMIRVLEIATSSRLNIIVSGGTGSGKTTLLNALSRYIATNERIVTIEDAAELQLQQPHVVRLETRPANLEGKGLITQGDLVRNALRMRPDRIILGETRGAEALDVLQAMNTGHDGSMTTLHANSPRDAITRLESLVMMASSNWPLLTIRRQIASAVHLLVHVERMRDGSRKITSITELAGMEGEVVVTQDLFTFNYDASAYEEVVRGRFDSSGLRPMFADKAAYFGMEQALTEAMRPT